MGMCIFYSYFLSANLLFKVHLVESCHTIGLSLLIFRILPVIDNVTGLFILNGVCIVPSILNLFSSNPDRNPGLKILTLITDIASVLMQLSVCLIPYILKTTETITNDLRWQLPLALFLISLGYWESFLETNFSKKHVCKWFQYNIRLLKKTRPKVYITASLLKISVLITSAIYFLPKTIERNMYLQVLQRIPIGEQFHQQFTFYDQYEDLFRVTHQVYIPFVIHVISSCICYYTGRIACKVRRKVHVK
jgi:chitin synthase